MDPLAAAAAAMGVPEPLVERSARAWADSTGQPIDQVLSAWASVDPGAATPAPQATPVPTSSPGATNAETTRPPEPATENAPTPAPAPVFSAADAVTAPTPARVSTGEALNYPAVVTVPTAGITERVGFPIPAWLGALLLCVPVFGLTYLALGSDAAECGSGTALRADRVTGMLENCDGSPFEGRGAAVGSTDFIAMGEDLYQQCAGCHGPQGNGGVGPALTGVRNTFAACADHIEWVALGSSGFQAEGRSTYGDTDKPIGGQMPPFGESLTDSQLAAVVAFERVRHAGGNPDEVLAGCGLIETEEGDGQESTAEADTDLGS